MQTTKRTNWIVPLLLAVGGAVSCSDVDFPDHELEVEFKYELTCSEMLLKYVTPEVTFTDGNGRKQTFLIEGEMWKGDGHKIWTQSVHYDSLNVLNTLTMRYMPNHGITYREERDFDYVHHLSCYISIREDGAGRRNNYTIIPDYPATADVSAGALCDFIDSLCAVSSIKGGSVDLNGEITKIEN